MSETKAQNDLLFCDYFEKWVKDYKEGNVRAVTLQKYHSSVTSLKKYAPDLKISELSRLTYQDIINSYAKDHEKVTVLDFNNHIKACVMDMLDEGLINCNPTKKVMIKGKEPKEKKPKFLSQFEVQCLIRTLQLGDTLNIDYLIFLLLKTGLRFSEALGLTPNDFDFNTQSITVNKTWCYKNLEEFNGVKGFSPTKNSSSARKIQVDWKTLQKFTPLIKNIPPNEPVFLYGRNMTLSNSAANDALAARCRQAKVPVIAIHSLRHTHASLLLANGVSVASVSKRLGHSNMATTQKVYLHIIKELENKDNGLALAAMMNLGE